MVRAPKEGRLVISRRLLYRPRRELCSQSSDRRAPGEEVGTASGQGHHTHGLWGLWEVSLPNSRASGGEVSLGAGLLTFLVTLIGLVILEPLTHGHVLLW